MRDGHIDVCDSRYGVKTFPIDTHRHGQCSSPVGRILPEAGKCREATKGTPV